MLKSIYDKVYNISPRVVKGYLSKTVFDLGYKPTAKINNGKKFPGGNKGGFVMSADFELAWAWRYTKTNNKPLELALKKARQERKNVPEFLKIFDEYDVPITWATVGHLFLENCKKSDHNWMKRVPHFDNHWRFLNGDWYDLDPYSNFKDAPEWYAPDLIELILKSRAKHEIGCHSFSHMNFRNIVTPPEVIEDELKACVDVAKRWNIKLKSFVFPGGTFGNFEILPKYGFTNYRENRSYDLFYPEAGEAGMVRLPSSFPVEDLKFNWTADYYVERFKKYIDKAIETGTVCHGWFHPSEDEWIVKEVFPPLMKYVSELRDKGLLYVTTMDKMSELYYSQ